MLHYLIIIIKVDISLLTNFTDEFRYKNKKNENITNF